MNENANVNLCPAQKRPFSALSTGIQYNQIAHEYARYRESDPAAIERLLARSGISSSSRVVEIGCGTGNYICAIQERVGCECFGVDPSTGMIAKARQRNLKVTFSVAPAERLGLPEAAFDLVFSADVIHHVQDRAACFREAFRVLRPGGMLATLTDSEDTIRRRMPLALYFPETVEAELRRYPAIKELEHYSELAGLTILGQEVVEHPYQLTDAESYNKKVFSCLRLISEEAFASGLARMKRDLRRGPIVCVARSLMLWNQRPCEAGPDEDKPLAQPISHDITPACVSPA